MNLFNNLWPRAFLTRREILSRCTLGIGTMALADLMGQAGVLQARDQDAALHPLAPRRPHFPAKAKRVIHIFPNGGASQVDTFDPKPALDKYKGKPLPIENYKTERKTGVAFPSAFPFKKHGQSG